MPRVFAYCRVSSPEQSIDNQRMVILAAGFAVEDRRFVSESISGSVPAVSRPGFVRLMDRLEEGDVLVVTALDRLGRNAMDVRSTVEQLTTIGVRVHCLALGGVDLTSSAGKLTMQIIAAVAEFERDLLLERTQAGMARAKAAGRPFGRKPALGPRKRATLEKKLLEGGRSIMALARDFETSPQTIRRVRDALTLKLAAPLSESGSNANPNSGALDQTGAG